MSDGRRLKFDEIGYWSEIKLDIVKGYASAYSRILAAQTKPALHHVYIDGHAIVGVEGAGHVLLMDQKLSRDGGHFLGGDFEEIHFERVSAVEAEEQLRKSQLGGQTLCQGS